MTTPCFADLAAEVEPPTDGTLIMPLVLLFAISITGLMLVVSYEWMHGYGGWLVAVVAAQSVSVLSGLFVSDFESGRHLIIFFSLVMWLGGGMLYIWIIALIFYRYNFFTLDARQLASPYWINIGAMAISTLAGTVLVTRANESDLLTDLLPFLKGADPAVLGNGHLMDTLAGSARCMAACHAQNAANV